MNAQAILQKIEDDAREGAAQAIADAQKKVTMLNEASHAKVETMSDEMVRQANAEGDALSERMQRMAKLETRKKLLERKRKLMDEAFEQAKDQLYRMPVSQAREFLLSQAAKAAQGNEQLIVGADRDDWFDQSFVDELNRALTAEGKQSVTAANSRRPGVMGVILGLGGTEVYCTFDAMLGGIRAELETDIAHILFND